MKDFSQLKLIPTIVENLKSKGYVAPTPIQVEAIPPVVEGKDLLGIAQTGTGKTAAFSVPILNRLGRNRVRIHKNHVRALILTPTRELASQILENLNTYGDKLNLSCAVIFGGVGKQPQISKLNRGLDILVATPGRLLDLMSEGHIKYDQLEVFVLDEADRMLDMGFFNDVKRVILQLPKQKQSLFFSATMPADIANLANSILVKPVKVEVTPQATTVEKIDQKIYKVERENKPSLLESILEDQQIQSVLIFARTKHGADRIVKKLEKAQISAAAIHGNKSQGAREKALGNFKAGEIRVLVATDIAARGIDIPQVSHVINYNIPEDPENYVHRIGRTARAGRSGISISFCDATEIKLLKNVEKFIRQQIPIDKSHPFHADNLIPVDKKTKTRKPRRGKRHNIRRK